MSQDTQANPHPADPILQIPLVIHTRSGVSSLDDPRSGSPSQHFPPACPALRRPCSAKLEENPPTPALSSPLTSKLRDTKPYNFKDTKARRHKSPPLGLGHCTRRDHPQQPQQIGEKNLRCSNLHELLLQTEAPFYIRHAPPHAHHLQDKLGRCRRDDKQQPNAILQIQLLSIEESKGKQGEKVTLGKVAGKQAQQREQETRLLLWTLTLP